MQYEIIEKATEKITLVKSISFRDGYVDVTTVNNDIINFENNNEVGELKNELYIIRDANTHVKADGTGTVEITEAGITDTEGVVAPTPAE